MKHSPVAFAVVALLVSAGCNVVGEELGDEDEDEYLDPGVQAGDGKMDGASSVGSVVSSTCSTVPVRGLSIQIAEEVRCLAPGLLVPFEESSSIRFASAAVLPYLEAETAEALKRTASSLGSVTINSGLRSVAQQYLLYRWRQAGRCGIRAAAPPGRSNHETGRALDLANSTAARSKMVNGGFSTLRSDPVHFDHLRSPDLRDLGVEAFQRLWNRNHPDDQITEDGLYGPETARRLSRAPSGGFSRGASCN
jgi:hypothetical protein